MEITLLAKAQNTQNRTVIHFYNDGCYYIIKLAKILIGSYDERLFWDFEKANAFFDSMCQAFSADDIQYTSAYEELKKVYSKS